MDVEEMIKEGKGTIVDVRTYEEFQGGNAEGSINIPLQILSYKINEIKSMKAPLILCCASGGRSAVASQMLKQYNIDCYDAGSWLNVNYYQSQTA